MSNAVGHIVRERSHGTPLAASHSSHGTFHPRDFTRRLPRTCLSKLLLATLKNNLTGPLRCLSFLRRATNIERRIRDLDHLCVRTRGLNRMAQLVEQVDQPAGI